MLLLIDNYDSFTYNLVQYFGELGVEVQVVRNDQRTIDAIAEQQPEYLVISPGPGTPNEAGISVAAIQALAAQLPILGVCLGHQSIGQAFGGHIIHARQIMHGKTSWIYHHQRGIFQGLPNPFQATRYHSLVIDRTRLPSCLEITAWTLDDNGEIEDIMAVEHQQLAVFGVQFHPESILTLQGQQLLHNFLQLKT